MNIIKPKQCDICHDKIGLYQPWYSIQVKGRLTFVNGLKNNPMSLCVNCFHAYKNFLIEHEVQENHKRNYIDIKHEEDK